jgi:hypothetical protein
VPPKKHEGPIIEEITDDMDVQEGIIEDVKKDIP